MGVVPINPLQRITFYQEKSKATGPWKTNSTSIGVAGTAVDALNALAVAAQAAYQEQQAKRDAARTATLNFRDAVEAMSGAGADLLKGIKAKAAAVGGNSVYVLADIPAPATPSPVPPPGTPADFKAQLNPDGSLKITWKCANPRSGTGTIYHVERRVGAAEGAFEFIGVSGVKHFVDATLPKTSGPVTYQIRAIRSTALGTANQFTVNFGVGGGGEVTAAVVAESHSPKMAA